MKKKILVLCEAFYPEDFLINDLVQEWEKEGKEVEVLTRVPSYPFGKVYPGYKNKIYQTTYFNKIKVHRFPVCPGYEKRVSIKLLNYFTFVFWSFWIILFIGSRFDTVFIYQTGPLTLATAGIFAKIRYKVETIIWTQDLWPETVYAYGFRKTKILDFFLVKFVKWVYTRCDVILVSCEGFIERIGRYVPKEKIKFIPNWSLMQYAPVRPVALPGKFNFTFAGNIGKVQNLENLIKGFALFVKKNPDVYLTIIGDGSNLGNLKRLVEHDAVVNVNFTGRKALNEMSDYYAASDVLILSLKDVPLYKHTVPSKFQVYLITGKPIYAVFTGEVKNIVEKHQIGFTAHPSDILEIAKGFDYFLNLSPEELECIADRAKKISATIYNRDKLIAAINNYV